MLLTRRPSFRPHPPASEAFEGNFVGIGLTPLRGNAIGSTGYRPDIRFNV